MSWVRLDDGFCDHPKIALLPIKARWVHLHGLCYCNRFLTDGDIPVEVAVRWEGPAAPAVLVERGLWTIDGDTYSIVGYLDWNDSKQKVEARRRADSERKRSGSRSDSEGIHASAGSGVEWSRKQQEEWFERFYAEFPRHDGRGAAERAFGKALKRADAEAIVAGAIAYAANPKRDPDFTAMPATWLNQDRWRDEGVVLRSVPQSDPAYTVGTPEYEARMVAEGIW